MSSRVLLLTVIMVASVGCVRNMRFQVCGAKLNNLISVVCNGHYNDPFPKKSSPQGMQVTEDAPFHWLTMVGPPDDEEDRLPAYSFSQGLFRQLKRTHGIVEECCYNSCSLTQMQQYCG